MKLTFFIFILKIKFMSKFGRDLLQMTQGIHGQVVRG